MSATATPTETQEGFYHVSIEFHVGTHRYAIGALSADDALEHVETYLIPKDYPGEAYLVKGVRFTGVPVVYKGEEL